MRTSAAQAHVLQYIAALLFRQIDVQNNEGRTGHVRLGIGPIEEPYGLFAVHGDMERERQPGGPYRLLDQKHVRFIVIDNQYVRVRSGGRLFRRGGRSGMLILVRVRIRPRYAPDTGPRFADKWPIQCRFLRIHCYYADA